MSAKPKAAASRARKTKTPAKPKPTRDQLLAAMAPLLKQVDDIMARPGGRQPIFPGSKNMRWNHVYSGPLREPSEQLRSLLKQLDDLERDKNADAFSSPAGDLVRARFSTAPGAQLSWAKPGSFLVHCGTIPMRVTWGGTLLPNDTGFYALDAKQLFLTHTGFYEVGIYDIGLEMAGPEVLLRERLQSRMSHPGYGQIKMELLNADARKATEAFRADPANAWWVKQASRSPVDPISIPLNSPPVQRSLFG